MKMLHKLRYAHSLRKEEGFTLIELLVVIVIIGVLAAIALPIFLNQQEAAMSATLKSDVRNTNMQVVTLLTKTPTASDVSGAHRVISRDETKLSIEGKWDKYTVCATNSSKSYKFDSTTGKYSEDCENAAPVVVPGVPSTPAADFPTADQAASIKAVVKAQADIAKAKSEAREEGGPLFVKTGVRDSWGEISAMVMYDRYSYTVQALSFTCNESGCNF